MEDLHPDHQILLLLSLTQLWGKKNSRLPPLQHRPLPLKSPISYQGEPGVCFTYDEIYRSVDPLRFSLIAKLSSGRPSVDEIRPHVRTHWMMNSEVHIGLVDPRHVITRFSSQEDFIQAWTRESLVIKATYFKFLWAPPWFDLRFESSIAPLLISLPNLPQHFFNPDYQQSIAGG
ncbi:hypothetical protein CDL15_Pgr000018 [Punica granatum]|uniref:DUF4283 domain-containing protein n=1 Tax=Punica granatum TaxID=22663 RepID=A0A218VQ06_PUNGR|nr:hypothetical protein CDL15_Pgr000018 [Punica granatum]